MDWIVLGSGSCIPSLERGPSGHALKIGRELILFDLGSGAVSRLAKAGLDYRKINHVVISHFTHPDHVNDLITLFMAFKVAGDVFKQERKPLHLYGPKGLERFVKNIYRLYPFLDPLGFKVKIHELKDKQGRAVKLSKGRMSLTAFKALHPKALSYLFSAGGKKIFYSGDTAFHPGLARQGQAVDLMVLECSYSFKSNGHLDPETCGRIASQAKPKKLLLTHFYSVFKQSPARLCRRHFKGKVVEAKDLLKVKV
jgi:ribonuclease BN (tRNA processing enzyme)